MRAPQVAIVTGGDSGIGRSMALLLAKEGAKGIAIVHTPKEQKVGARVREQSWGCGGLGWVRVVRTYCCW